jgi:hypothetical protein
MASSPVKDSPVAGNQTEAGLRPSAFGKHVFQLPANPKGLVVFLPGCARGAFGFWPRSAAGGDYLGFPEDVSHTKQILKKGYGILVLTPNTTSGSLAYCWTDKAGDGDVVVKSVADFRKRHNLEKKPLYFAGASSGGGMAQGLLSRGAIRADGMIAEVSTSRDPSTKSPMTVWIAMSERKEQTTANGRARDLARFGKPSGVLISPKKRVTPEFFADQMTFINKVQSAQMVDALRKVRLIDGSGNILADPKNHPWRTKLPQMLPWMKTSPLYATVGSVRLSPILQALMNAYSRHEHTAMFTTAILSWFESGGKADLKKLADSQVVTKPAYFSAV